MTSLEDERSAHDAGPLYAPAHSEVRIERLSDLTLTFHRLSSETHILSPDMDAIFSEIPDVGGTASDIFERLEAAHGVIEAESDPVAIVAARLEELSALGLIRRLPHKGA
ncbi:MAG: HPr-rel-A system PqqD family peptide chaperone [Pacificimonas sp.]